MSDVPVTVHILLNQNPMGFLRGFQDTDPLVKAYAWGTSSPGSETIVELLERIYYKFNVEHPGNYTNRSLSVGDVVVLQFNDGYIARSVRPAGYDSVPMPAVLHYFA